MPRKRKYQTAAEKQRAYRARKRNAQALRSAPAQIDAPPLRYHGGKWRLANWIINQFPPHECYVEPYAGGASVLLNKPSSKVEVINDLNSDIITFFDVLRGRPDELIRAIELTPYSREMLDRARQPADDPLEKALRLYIRCWQSYGVSEGRWSSGWRYQRDYSRGSSIVINDWSRTEHLWAVAARLKRVFIEHDEALNVIARFDTPNTLFYVDPPYLKETRSRNWRGAAYPFEMTNEEHRTLAATLRMLRGMVVLSGYPSPLYDELYHDWTRLEKSTTTNGNNTAIECLWLSPNATALARLPLFESLSEEESPC